MILSPTVFPPPTAAVPPTYWPEEREIFRRKIEDLNRDPDLYGKDYPLAHFPCWFDACLKNFRQFCLFSTRILSLQHFPSPTSFFCPFQACFASFPCPVFPFDPVIVPREAPKGCVFFHQTPQFTHHLCRTFHTFCSS